MDIKTHLDGGGGKLQCRNGINLREYNVYYQVRYSYSYLKTCWKNWISQSSI